MISVFSYWPFNLVETTNKRIFSYTDKTGTVPSFRSEFYYDFGSKQLVCADYVNGIWTDDWRMIYDPNRGVAEVADWYPQNNSLLASLFGPTKKQLLSLADPMGKRG